MRSREIDQQKSISAQVPHTPASSAAQPAASSVPEAFEFMIRLPFAISALDYDIVKLTALYVARNGRHFMLSLSQRESKNPQFYFLRPNHTLHPIFLRLISQYSKIILPSQEVKQAIATASGQLPKVLQKILARVNYTRKQQYQQAMEEETRERERVAFASIDWHDFSIAETIDFGPSDQSVDLPKPFNPHKISLLSFVQRRELWNDQVLSTETTLSYDVNGEAEMDVEMSTDTTKPSEIYNATDSLGGGSTPVDIKLKHDYLPRALRKDDSCTQEATEVCPLCYQSFPKSSISEHIRIESLDPKWNEQRNRYISKHVDSNYVTSGEDLALNLGNLARARNELSKLSEAEASEKISKETRAVASKRVIWDGRVESESTRDASDTASRDQSSEASANGSVAPSRRKQAKN